MIRLGIIGPGLIWQKRHKSAIGKLKDDFEITAFCAASEKHKAAALEEFPTAAFETDSRKFMQREDIDAVVVLTPIELNAPMAQAALEAGKDVFLEKPMASSLTGGKILVETARKSGRKLWLLEQEVYDPRWSQLIEIIQKGEIGELVYFNYIVHSRLDSNEWNRGGYGHTNWRIKPAYPLGALMDGGHHSVAILSRLFGQPEWVFASGSKLREEFGDYDHVLVQMGYKQSLLGTFSHSALLPEGGNSFTIWGTHGVLQIGDKEFSVVKPDGLQKKFPVQSCAIHEVMWQEMAACIVKGSEPSYISENALADLITLFGIEKSIRTQMRVSL